MVAMNRLIAQGARLFVAPTQITRFRLVFDLVQVTRHSLRISLGQQDQ